MSELTACIFGAIAVTLSFGAAQFALGGDLSADSQSTFATQSAAVNRATKTDRASGVPLGGGLMQTISLQLSGVRNASVLVRIPVADGDSPPALTPGSGHAILACEPVASVLSEAAKKLPPGRCVT